MRHYSVILYEDQIQALATAGYKLPTSRAVASARIRELIDGHLYPNGVPDVVADERALARKMRR